MRNDEAGDDLVPPRSDGVPLVHPRKRPPRFSSFLIPRSNAFPPYSFAMRYKLTSTDGVHNYDLRHGSALVVGRAPTSDIAIFDPTISRRHAEVQLTESGIHVRDLGSSNGTYLNGAKV